MKTRVLFLDDEPQTHRRFREALEKQGFTICVPKSLEEAFYEINMNGAELLIHCAHRTETFLRICDGITKQYPHFPTLHFATGEASEPHSGKMRGSFHVSLRPLIPEKQFLKRVR